MLVIDLRSAEQRQRQPVQVGLVLPLSMAQIEEGTYELPKAPKEVGGAPIWVVCEQGMHAQLAARYLQADGHNAQAWTGSLAQLAQVISGA